MDMVDHCCFSENVYKPLENQCANTKYYSTQNAKNHNAHHSRVPTDRTRARGAGKRRERKRAERNGTLSIQMWRGEREGEREREREREDEEAATEYYGNARVEPGANVNVS